MLNLIVTFLFALAIAYFAIQNTYTVPVVVANNVFNNIPLYFLIIGSVLTGIILATLLSSIDALSAYMKLRGKEQVIKDDQKAIHALQSQVHELEVENNRLQAEQQHTIEQNSTMQDHHEKERETEERVVRPFVFQNFRRTLMHPRA